MITWSSSGTSIEEKEKRDACHQWSTRPDPQSRQQRSLFSLESCFVLWYFENLGTDGRTDGYADNTFKIVIATSLTSWIKRDACLSLLDTLGWEEKRMRWGEVKRIFKLFPRLHKVWGLFEKTVVQYRYDPRGRPTVTVTIFTRTSVQRRHFLKISQNKQISSENSDRYRREYGSLMTHIISSLLHNVHVLKYLFLQLFSKNQVSSWWLHLQRQMMITGFLLKCNNEHSGQEKLSRHSRSCSIGKLKRSGAQKLRGAETNDLK